MAKFKAMRFITEINGEMMTTLIRSKKKLVEEITNMYEGLAEDGEDLDGQTLEEALECPARGRFHEGGYQLEDA